MSCFHLRTEHVVEIIFDDHVFVIFLSLITVKFFSGGCNVIVFQPFLCTVHEIKCSVWLGRHCNITPHECRTAVTLQWYCIYAHMQCCVCIISPLQKHHVKHSWCAATGNGPNLSEGRPSHPVRAMEFRGESREQDWEPERNKHHTLVAVQKIMFIPVMSSYIYICNFWYTIWLFTMDANVRQHNVYRKFRTLLNYNHSGHSHVYIS